MSASVLMSASVCVRADAGFQQYKYSSSVIEVS